MIKEIKSIPLATFLSQVGHNPVQQRGSQLWYRSPLRQEKTPSFKVDTTINCWYDFGLGQGGNILDLAMLVYGTTNIRQLIGIFRQSVPSTTVHRVAPSATARHTAPGFTEMEIKPLQHRALVAYLQERGIPPAIAIQHCREAHYSHNGKRYFAVAFYNVSGRLELRNRYFKGCHGHKDISFIRCQRQRDGPATECIVFEGFIDFLSSLALDLHTDADAIVLNSVCLVNKAIPYLKGYSHIHCCLDNDEAGQRALTELTRHFPNQVNDLSKIYRSHNDLNDYLVNLKNRKS